MFALDTNTLIFFFKGIGRVKEQLLATSPAEIAIPSVVLYELEVGIAQSTHASRRRRELDALLEVVRVLPFDSSAAKISSRISAELRSRGSVIGPMDTLIAGTALAGSATLVTHNEKEFSRVPGLQLADWY